MIARVRTFPGGSDAYGDPIPGTVEETEIEGAFVAPRESTDVHDRGRQGVIVGLTLYAPYDTDLVHTDQVRVAGDLYDVDGEVGRWLQPWSQWEAGITAALTRAAG